MVVGIEEYRDRKKQSKQPPNERQQAFIDIASRIRINDPTPTLEEINKLSSIYRDIATALRRIRIDGDEEDFWKAYDVYAETDHPLLNDWRSVVGVPAPAGEQNDHRFKIGKNGKKVIIRYTEDDIDALPDIEYLIGNTLQACGVSMIFGPSGTGKTFNALNIAYCIAHGIHWFGRPVKQGKVWYINTEGGHGLKLRTAAWRKECGRGKTPNIEFITWPVQLKDHYRELLDTLEEADEKPSLLIVDNYSMCAVGTNQNDQMEVTQALMVLHEISQRYGCHCMIVHHANWTGKVNGSAAFRNHVDTMIDLSHPSKESPIVLSCNKQRDAEQFADIHLELKVIPLYAHPETGETITSCVVVPSDAPLKNDLNPKQRQCLDLLVSGLTLGEWCKFVEDANVGVSRRTLERFRDLFEEKGLIERKENQGKHDTYIKKSGFSTVGENDDDYAI